MEQEEQLRAQLEEVKIQLLDQGCKTIRDAIKRDEEAFVQMVDICLALGDSFSDEVMGIYHKLSGQEVSR